MLNQCRLTLLSILLFFSSNLFVAAGNLTWEELISSGQEAVVQGKLPLAEQRLLAALGKAQKFDAADPRLTESMRNLAMLYEKMKRFDKAEKLYLSELKIVAPLGENYKDTLPILIALGRVSEAQCKYSQAEKYFRKAQTINRNLPSRSEDNINCVLDWRIGHICDLQGKYAEGEPLLLEALTLKNKGAVLEPDMVELNDQLADCFNHQGKFDDAETYGSKALALKASKVGQNSPDLIGYLIRLNYIYCNAGKFEKAEPLARRALQIARNSRSCSRIQLADRLMDLANLCCRLNKYGEAESYLKEALVMYKRHDPGNYECISKANLLLAGVYVNQRKFKAAKPLFEAAFEFKMKTSHPNDAETVSILDLEGLNYCNLNRPKEAEQAFKKALALQERLIPTKEHNIVVPIVFLADFYLSKKRCREAEPLYRRALALKEPSSSRNDVMTAHILRQLANTCVCLGHDSEAEDLHKRAIKAYEDLPSQNQGDLAACLLDLGNLYARRKNFADAETVYKYCLTVLRDAPGLHEQYIISVERYANLLRKTNRNKKADKLLEQARATTSNIGPH